MPSSMPGAAGAPAFRAAAGDAVVTAATTLGELASAIEGSEQRGEAPIGGAAIDSRRVRPGDAFLAAHGEHADGHDFAAEALARGAAALVVERFVPVALPQLRVPSVAAVAATIATMCYAAKRSRLRLVGVTGTNGKTTTCELLRACLSAPGSPAGQIGTTGVRLGARQLESSPLTTPQAPDLQGWLARLADAGAGAAAVEVSSHGLALGRVDGIFFDVAVFTNLSPEHLDFHGSLERYFAAKAGLFEPHRCGEAVICIDDEWGVALAGRCPVPAVTFGRSEQADVRVDVDSHGLAGITVVLEAAAASRAARVLLGAEPIVLVSPLVGRINAANVAAAYLAALRIGVSAEAAASAIACCGPPPGRFQVVSDPSAGEPLVVVDYAHTPDALGALIATAREVAPGRVHAVLGARGGRYRAKRPEMGRRACEADEVSFTTDSPGDEEPVHIVDDLLGGVPPAAAGAAPHAVAGAASREGRSEPAPGASAVVVRVQLDRAEAIRSAVLSARSGDAVVISGRGHEETQRFGERVVPLDDRVTARLALGSLQDASPSPLSVSAVIPARNAAASLAAAIESILAQEAPVAEVIVVDDASSDETTAVAASFGDAVRLLNRGGHGPSAARNAGIAESSSAWVAFCDADDRWHPAKLAAQLEVVSGDPDCVLCATDWLRPGAPGDWLGVADRTLRARDPAPAGTSRPGRPATAGAATSQPRTRSTRLTTAEMLVLNRFQTSGVLARRDALCRIGGFEPAFDGSEDWDCWLRLSRLGTVHRIASPLVAYADSAAGVSKDLARVYETAIAVVSRQLAAGGVARARELAAWHRLRFAVAFALGGDRAAAVGCLADLRRDGLLAPALPAAVRLLVPFLAGRAARRLLA